VDNRGALVASELREGQLLDAEQNGEKQIAGGLVMLTAYFDDSGTHSSSDIVCWAGLFGNQFQWASFDQDWKKRLHESLPGRDPINKFHMYDCQNALNEYSGWKRHEIDFFCDELGRVIVKNGLYGYALGIARKEWDAEVQGDRRRVLGDAEAYCVANCFLMAERWATRCAPHDKQLAFVFDKREHRIAKMEAVFDIFEKENKRQKLNLLNPRTPDLVSLTFSLSSKFRPLQGADLFAWEYYQNCKDVLTGGPDVPERSQFRRLIKQSGRMIGAIADPKTLKGLANRDTKDDYAELLKHAPANWPF
jgi:hypothetical protein